MSEVPDDAQAAFMDERIKYFWTGVWIATR
jgi:hypothetical protein